MKKLIALFLALTMVAALAVAVSADNYVASVTDKHAPEIISVKDDEGGRHDAYITDKDGNITYLDENSDLRLVLTSIADADKAPAAAVEPLKNAYKQLDEAKPLTAAAPALADKLGDVKPTDTIVIDLFDASLVDKDGNVVPVPADSTLTFSVLTPCKDGDFFVALHDVNDTWEVADCTLDEKGIATINATSLGPFAFVAEYDGPDDDGPESPKTGDSAVALIAGSVALIAAAAWISKKH